MTAPLDRLRPVVRTSAELAPTVGPDTYVRRPAGMLLVEAIRLNDAYNPRLVTHADLAEWGIEADAAFARARENLSDERRAFLMEQTPYGSAVVRNVQPVGYATTWALNPAFITGMMPPAPNGIGKDAPLVFVPEPETMLIARSSNVAEIKAASAVARACYDAAAHKLAPGPFEYTADGLLEPWLPADGFDAELERSAAEARAAFVVQVYGEACDAYAATPETRKYSKAQGWALNRPALLDAVTPGVELRQATWQPSKTVLVPAYAQVRFVPNKGEGATVGLAELAARVPELVAGFMLDPSWVVLGAFPSPAQLAALRGDGVDQ